MPINLQECYNALAKLDLAPDLRANYKKMCDDKISIAGLFIDEIPKKGNCQYADALHYIEEESKQMSRNLGRLTYNMFDISVPEHVYNEDQKEDEHPGIYTPASGDMKFFEEWLEGHHPSLGCLVNQSYHVPSDNYYAQLEKARIEARKFR
jgi:hypothetical protein